MTFAAEVERVWPGRGARFEVLGGGITNHNLKVEVDGEYFVLRVAGKDTNLLGIDRTRRARRDRGGRGARDRPRGRRVRRAGGLARHPVRRGSDSSAGADARAGDARARCGCAARVPRRSGDPRSVRLLPRGRDVSEDGARPRRERARGVRSRARDRRADRGETRSRRPRPVPQRSPERELPGRRRAPLHRRLGVRGDGRPLLRPRELLDQPRARRDAERGAARGVLRRACARRTSRHSSSCASCPTSARRCGAWCSRPCPSSTSTSTRMRPSTSSGSSERRPRPRSSRRSGLNARGAPCGAPRSGFERVGYRASVGSANCPACSSSSRSSSSSVPIRTGPLNQFLAERNHQPPKSSPMPANRRGSVVVHSLPGEAVLPRGVRPCTSGIREQDADEAHPDDRRWGRSTCSGLPSDHARGSSQLALFRSAGSRGG